MATPTIDLIAARVFSGVTSMEGVESSAGALGTCSTVQISGANEDVEVDIGIPDNDQTVSCRTLDLVHLVAKLDSLAL